MNRELLKRLYDDAVSKCNDNTAWMFEERFAELIIQECMDMCKTAVGNADYNTGRLHCLENIKEHFGVEE